MSKIPLVIHESWHKYLQPLFDDERMEKLKFAVSKHPYYPAAIDVFRAFSLPFNEVKVVIIGQDPYPRGEAIGLAFAVDEKIPLPASLRIIEKEIQTSNSRRTWFNRTNIETGEKIVDNIRKWKTLQHWVDQGIFLLNAALTVEQLVSGSHLKLWRWFTEEVIRIVSSEISAIWLLWGAEAQKFIDNIEGGFKIRDLRQAETISDSTFNMILKAPHPAAETYSDSPFKFTGCNHFNICNEILKNNGKTTINW